MSFRRKNAKNKFVPKVILGHICKLSMNYKSMFKSEVNVFCLNYRVANE